MGFFYDTAIGAGDRSIITRSINRVIIAKICQLLKIDWNIHFHMGHSGDDRDGYLEDVLEFLHVTDSDFDWNEDTGYLQLNLDLPRNTVEFLVEDLTEQWSEYYFEEIIDEETDEPVDFVTYNDKGVELYMKYYRGYPYKFFKAYYELILSKRMINND